MNNTTNSCEEIKEGLKKALRWSDFDTFATDGDSRSSLDRAVDYVCTLLHDTEIAAREEGIQKGLNWNNPDILAGRLEQARKEAREEIKKARIEGAESMKAKAEELIKTLISLSEYDGNEKSELYEDRITKALDALNKLTP